MIIVALVLLWVAATLIALAFCSMSSLADSSYERMTDREFWEHVDDDGRLP